VIDIIEPAPGGVVQSFTQIFITNPELKNAGGKIYIGVGSTLEITWESREAPTVAQMRLFLDGDGVLETQNDQVEITPEGGTEESQKKFALTLDISDFRGRTSLDYFVIAQVTGKSDVVVAQTVSKGVVHVGEGGIVFTDPETDITVATGQQLIIKWELTGDICTRQPDLRKTLRLYIDTVPEYRDGRSQEISGVNGIDACSGEPEFALRTDNLEQLTPYYIIGRLFLQEKTEEESRAIASGSITLSGARLNVLKPVQDITANFGNVLVTWEVLDATSANKLVRIAAVEADGDLLTLSPNYAAAQGQGQADASKLPPGTYRIRCLLLELDESGREIKQGSSDATGKIVVPEGYRGTYDLFDMARASKTGFSPVKGAVFTGFNINDEAGYQVAGLGDLDSDGFSEIAIFTRFGQEYTTGMAGSLYVIYGSGTGFPPNVDLNSIASPTGNSPVTGTLLLFPMENLPASALGRVTGAFDAVGLPDVSGDAKGDLFIVAREARPLAFEYRNYSHKESMEIIDRYGLTWSLGPAGDLDLYKVWTEPDHVLSWFRHGVGAPLDEPTFWSFIFNFDYGPGDRVFLVLYPEYDENGEEESYGVAAYVDRVGETRSATYMVPSQRLAASKNQWLDLAFVGNPLQQSGGAIGKMRVWLNPDVRFGGNVSAIPDIDGDGWLELLLSAPEESVTDAAGNMEGRAQAGAVVIYKTEPDPVFDTDLGNKQGAIAWAWSWMGFNSTYKDIIIENFAQITIIGAQSGSKLTGAAGLGHFPNLTTFNTYVNGDFNGDNTADIVMGAPGENNGAGAIYIMFLRTVLGHRIGMVDLADFNREIIPGPDPTLEVPGLGVKVDGTIQGERLGELVTTAGDFNDDGLADVAFTLPKANASGKVETGRVFILFGQEGIIGDYTLDDVDSHLGSQLPGLIFEGQNAFDHFGSKACLAQDVNGDGIDDILITAPDADAPGKNDCGKVYVIFGKRDIIKSNSNGFNYVDYDGNGQPDEFWSAQTVGTTLPGIVFVGEDENNHLQAAAGAGDVNGDGVGDILLGSPFVGVSKLQKKVGRAYVIFGSRN
jgi:hypothetical protein